MDVPIKGVVGVIGGAAPDLERQLRALDEPEGSAPDSVEIRADLFPDPREALHALDDVRRRRPVLFTVRLPTHGGRYAGSEADRIEIYHEALRRGAALLDAEIDSEAAARLSRDGVPLVVSFHDFFHGLASDGFRRLLTDASRLAPMVLKVVPTAERPQDAIECLRWVSEGVGEVPRRVAFTMGDMGTPSRILSLAWGSAWTYAALGPAVAPGQVSAREMKLLFRADRLGRATPIIGAVGSVRARTTLAFLLNRALAARGIDAVAIPLAAEALRDLLPVFETLPVRRVAVAPPLRGDALEAADEADPRAREAGGADGITILREGSALRLYATITEPRELTELSRTVPSCGRGEVDDAVALARAEVELFRLGAGPVEPAELQGYLQDLPAPRGDAGT